MRKILWQLNLTFLIVVLGSGCASNNYHYREASYDKKVEKGTILHALWFPPGIEDKILALDPGHIEETDIREVLARGPAPRIINIYGAYYGVHLSMISFSEFLIGMGYPETKIRNPRNGTYGYSPYTNSAKIAGLIAWYHEKEGMRVILAGHSAGGVQVVKVLHQLAGTFSDELAVWNPLTEEQEDRISIIDPITGGERPVVGLQIGYATAVGAGGLGMLLPHNWSMIGRLRKIPDTAEHFTGFYQGLDLLGGSFLGLIESANVYGSNGTAKVRNVKLPSTYNHATIPDTAHLAENEAIKDWINKYVPTNEPKFTVKFSSSSKNILWAADVWYSIKKQWCLEAQRLIRAKRSMRGPIGRRGSYGHTVGRARMKQSVP